MTQKYRTMKTRINKIPLYSGIRKDAGSPPLAGENPGDFILKWYQQKWCKEHGSQIEIVLADTTRDCII